VRRIVWTFEVRSGSGCAPARLRRDRDRREDGGDVCARSVRFERGDRRDGRGREPMPHTLAAVVGALHAGALILRVRTARHRSRRRRQLREGACRNRHNQERNDDAGQGLSAAHVLILDPGNPPVNAESATGRVVVAAIHLSASLRTGDGIS